MELEAESEHEPRQEPGTEKRRIGQANQNEIQIRNRIPKQNQKEDQSRNEIQVQGRIQKQNQNRDQSQNKIQIKGRIWQAAKELASRARASMMVQMQGAAALRY